MAKNRVERERYIVKVLDEYTPQENAFTLDALTGELGFTAPSDAAEVRELQGDFLGMWLPGAAGRTEAVHQTGNTEGDDMEIRKTAVVGCGQMGTGVLQVFAQA
jgi:hypothetical protein